MNRVAEDILSCMDDDEFLAHYGMPRRSGRYPWGSGDDAYQHGSRDLLGRVEELKKTGWTETPENIKKEFGISTTEYRNEISLAKNERKMLRAAKMQSMRDDGASYTEIGREFGCNESTVRSILDKKATARRETINEVADFIKKEIDKKGMIDVGSGVEHELGITETKLHTVLTKLEKEGYPLYKGRIEQVTNPNGKTTQTIICKPGTKHEDIYKDQSKIHALFEENYAPAEGSSLKTKRIVYPKSMDSSRLHIRYKDEAGADGVLGIEKDGLIEIRRGVEDLSLGNNRYAQVRILVDDKKYLKGMAVYSDDIPDGVDVVFNTNKSREDGLAKTLKDIKNDPDAPFGSLIQEGGQSYYTDKNGKEQLSLINKVRSEGNWEDWQDSLPSQFLSKQSLNMASKQLNLAAADKLAEFDDICSLTNPTLKKHYLKSFADDCDAAAVHLKAAALPRQKNNVIIPINAMKDDEVYAPRYKDGEKLALIRYPHGGTFEIPILTVNNKNPIARKLLGTDITDAVGINSSNAERLSGADFDGDTVMCIPTHDSKGRVHITSTPRLKGLIGFDPKTEYAEVPGMRYMKNPITGKDNTQREMGIISNLICDMTLAGATNDELAAAVRHSMVVIDAGKHKLNYKQSELDNNIAALKKKYQVKLDENGNPTDKAGGAATIISRAKGEDSTFRTQGEPRINVKYNKDGSLNKYYDPSRPEGANVYKVADDLYYPNRTKFDRDSGEVTYRTVDGKKVTYNINDKAAVEKYKPIERRDEKTGEVTFTNKAGDIVYDKMARTQKTTKMANTDDARTLISAYNWPMEQLYADYANQMKSLANRARVEYTTTQDMEYNPSAAKVYAEQVESLKTKVAFAELNRPRERAAQRAAIAEIESKRENNELGTEKKEVQKAKQRAITKFRYEVGGIARRDRAIQVTDSEWEAIQSGAVRKTLLEKILANSDAAVLREKAMPRATTKLSEAKVNRINSLRASNYTLSQIAEKLGVSESVISNYIRRDN